MPTLRRSLVALLLALLAGAAPALTSLLRTGSDDCATPIPIVGRGQFNFDLTTATTGTTGQNEQLCASFTTSGIESDLWYCWTADASGCATVTTCSLTSIDTKIAVYPGCGCPTPWTALDCNDDFCSLQSTISWPVTRGTSYTLQVGVFPGAAVGTGMFDISLRPCDGAGTAVCFGDGGGTPCPCSNEAGPGEGCANSSGAGAVLGGTGRPSIALDELVLMANGLLPGQPCLFFQGDSFVNGGAGTSFGDGLRCCGTTVVRLVIVVPDASGCAATDGFCGTVAGGTPGPISQHPSNGALSAGDTKCYQCWYRDPSPSAPCSSTFNLSNARAVQWLP
jgi:hypothetical protein